MELGLSGSFQGFFSVVFFATASFFNNDQKKESENFKRN